MSTISGYSLVWVTDTVGRPPPRLACRVWRRSLSDTRRRRALDAIFAEAETDEALRNRLLAYTPIEYVAITITDPRKHQRTGYTAWLGSWR